MNEWKVTWQAIAGEKIFRVYRTINKYEPDHSGNREYADGMYKTESLAREEADRLNGNVTEDKSLITQKLLEVMRMTRQFDDLESLEYRIEDNKEEFVYGTFRNGGVKRAYVTGDSGYALLKDVLWQLV